MEEKYLEIDDALEMMLTGFLAPYAKDWYRFSISNHGNLIEVEGKKKEEDISSFILLRLVVSNDNGSVYIPNICIPREDRGNGIGFTLLSLVFQVAEKCGYMLFLIELTDSFREKMLKRGALETNVHDALQIVDTTRLKHLQD